MISVVICSINESLAQQVKSNIDKTIGVPWQPIIIDNTNPSRAIAEVYNVGAGMSRFSVICFVHEDISFETPDWGRKLVSHFDDDPGLGMIGVAGSNYKSRTLSGWMTFIESCDRCNILHVDGAGKITRLYYDQPPAKSLKNVVTLDGVFLCIRRDILANIHFDETMLKGFHLYDLDISYRVSRQHRVAVCFDIDIIHYTEGGDFGNNWVDHTLKWHKRYSDQLPVSIDNQADKNYEYRVKYFWLKRLRSENISFRRRISWIQQSKVVHHLSLWPQVFLFLLYRPLEKILKKSKKAY
jgi:hypothetical protein